MTAESDQAATGYKYSYQVVPRDPELNALWRKTTLEYCNRDHPDAARLRERIMELCRKDFWYWSTAFSCVHEPRVLDDDATVFNTKVPFLPWPHQVPVVDRILKVLGTRDLRVVKSRAQGASWMLVLIFIWCWLFIKGFKGNLVSKDETAVDRRNDMDSLMAKCLAVGTRVLTPAGWRAIEDIRVGDFVVGSTGSPTEVVRALPEHESELIRLTFSDGTAIDCTEDHLWPVTRCTMRMSGNRKRCYHNYENVSAAEIAENLRPAAPSLKKHWNWQVMSTPAIEFLEAELPIDPYVMGVLLGDGSLSKSAVEFVSMDKAVVDGVREGVGVDYRVTPTGTCSWIIATADCHASSANGIGRALRSLGLRGHRAWEKFIPELYQTGSRQQRLELLRGLMDTDGSVNVLSNGNVRAEFTTTSRQLAEDVQCLCRSLGGVSLISKRAPTYRYGGEVRNGRPAFRVGVSLEENPFRLPRKSEKFIARNHTTARRIVGAERIGTGAVKCITVEAEDGLFVTEGMILTHNCDWELQQLPDWMVGLKNKHWRRNYGEHYLMRMDGETAITGYACTADVASGGRAMVFAMDEHAKHPRGPDREALAATQPITRCRLFISTPKGKTGAYAELVHDDTIEEPVLYLSWRDNPTQNRGLYRIVKGYPVAVDEEKYGPLFPEYTDRERWLRLKERLSERGYDITGDDTRSSWYDQECLRPGANPVLVAQEYDMVFGAEGAQYFAEALVNRLKSRLRRPLRGEFSVDTETLTGKWSENIDGRLRLWCELDIRGNPPMGEYVVGVDVASGIGGSQTSNSSISVFNRRTGQKVASFASPSVHPYALGELAIAICRWFVNYRGDPAFLIWEDNGYGQELKVRVERSDFRYYYRRTPKNAPLHSADSQQAGYWTTKRSNLLGPYREALLEGYFDNPEYEAVDELRQYQMGPDGEPYHVGENDREDPAGAKAAHGDRVISDALCWWASLKFGDQMRSSHQPKNINVMNVRECDVSRESYAWRRAQYLKMLGKQKAKTTW